MTGRCAGRSIRATSRKTGPSSSWGRYRRNALQVHRDLAAKTPLTPAHFARWLELWITSVDDRYVGPVAELARLQAGRIAGSMNRRLSGHSDPLPLATPHPVRGQAVDRQAPLPWPARPR